ncbi:MAG: NAD(+) diphosphatase [Actinomycetota bacterium]|nr:NAD(+) diphosphatase [Actinomycetota bacterium]
MDLLDELALSRHVHDRVARQRVDEAWLDAAWADPRTRVLLVHDGAVSVQDDRTALRFVSPAEAARAGDGEGSESDRFLLGVEAGTTYFGVLLPAAPAGVATGGLRELAVQLDARESGLLVHAVGVANWHRSHRFCPHSGGATDNRPGGHERRCERCGRPQFPRTDAAVIMLALDADDRCLLGHNTRSPRPRGFSTLAGFVEPGESLEHAVARELMEEVGIGVTDVRYFGSQPWPLPASLMVGFVATATSTEVTVDGDEISEARWFSRAELLAATETGHVLLPGRISIARHLIESWYGGTLPGTW